jgi:heme-binding protein
LLLSARAARRAVSATVFAGAIAGVSLFGVMPSAIADPPPGCSAADFEQVKANVATATAAYFFTHPDANAFFSSIKGQPKEQSRGAVKAYFASNPQVQAELAGVRQPMADFKGRCQ